ncbi:DUF2637 domain-containing protein [Streptomyces sp. LHD-70]|uniref:DUF2637 domain-containing protein n=1 Tax=Streptomyces sp. LHD-70 TaxID=3072140 RepID=UPI0035BE7EBF
MCAGGIVIAGIGFAGSYTAVQKLAEKKDFGNFSHVLPVGIDAGIVVLLALDLLLTWIRIPFPLLRQTAWLLTAATIAFNGASAWPDPLGVGMHAVIPLLFVVAVEAARHAIGRMADITADKHMEGVRFTRWLLSPGPTFLLWRRMKLWELRSYEQVISLEQQRLMYRALLRSRYGRWWRRKAPTEALMPLRLAKYGVRLAETAPAGLAAAGIDTAAWTPVNGALAETAEAPANAQQIDLDQHAATAIDIASTPPPAALTTAAEHPAQHTASRPANLPRPELRTSDERATTHLATQIHTAQQGTHEGAQDDAQQGDPHSAQYAQREQPGGQDTTQQSVQDDANDVPEAAADTSSMEQDSPRMPSASRKQSRPPQSRGARSAARETAQRAARKTPEEQAAWDAQVYALRNPEDGGDEPSNRELATQLGCSEGTVRNALQRHAQRLADERRSSLHSVGV